MLRVLTNAAWGDSLDSGNIRATTDIIPCPPLIQKQRQPGSKHWGFWNRDHPPVWRSFRHSNKSKHQFTDYKYFCWYQNTECGAHLYSTVTENEHWSNTNPLTLTAWTSVKSCTCSQNVVAAGTWRFPCWELLCCPNAAPLNVMFRSCSIFLLHQICFDLNGTRLIAKVLRAEVLSGHQMASWPNSGLHCLKSANHSLAAVWLTWGFSLFFWAVWKPSLRQLFVRLHSYYNTRFIIPAKHVFQM